MDRSSYLPLVLVLATVALVSVLVWSVWPSPATVPTKQTVTGIADSVTVTWVSENVSAARLRADDDIEWTLGYAHGMRRTWTLLLWRQAASGHLSTWFGEGVVPIDRHVHHLGIPHDAKRAYAALPDSTRRRVRAYTAGVNAALSSPAAQNADELLTLGLQPEPWEPWHTLAVEHLFSWLSTPQHLPGTNGASPAEARTALPASVRSVHVGAEPVVETTSPRADSLLRGFLHVGGLEASVAWSRPASESRPAQLATRLVTGSSALPLLHEMVLTREMHDDALVRTTGATLPGSLVWLAGTHARGPDPGASWTILPGHTPTVRRVAADSLQWTRRHVRLAPHAADELLVQILRVEVAGSNPALPLSLPEASSDASPPAPAVRNPIRDSVRVSVRDTVRLDSITADTVIQADTAIRADTVSIDPVAQDSIPVDSIWTLTWNGMNGRSDATLWTQLARGHLRELSRLLNSPSLPARTSGVSQAKDPSLTDVRLHDGTSLVMGADESLYELGPTPFLFRGDGVTIVGRSAWTEPVAQALLRQEDRRAAAETQSDTSAWAAEILEDVLPHLQTLESETGPVQEALTYLQNWDATFERASIGASVFDEWMRAYAYNAPPEQEHVRLRLPARAGVISDSLRPDTTYFAAHRQRRAFRRAVERLVEEHGPDLRQWRWERVAIDRRSFPVWSAGEWIDRDLSSLATTRYAPIDVPGRGHRSTPSGGPTLLSRTVPSPAATWTAWTSPERRSLVVRRSVFDVSDFFARPFLRRDRPADVTLLPAGSHSPDTLR